MSFFTLFCLIIYVFTCYQLETGKVDYVPTYFECVAHAYLYLSDVELAFSYISNLLIGLVLAAVATIPTFKQLLAEEKLAKEAPVATEFEEPPVSEATENTEPAPEQDTASEDNTVNH